MKKKLFSIIMCILMIMCFMPTAAFAQSTDSGTTPVDTTTTPQVEETTNAKTIYVDGSSTAESPDGTADKPYKTIQAGINAASDGDTVLVKEGNYNVWCPIGDADNKRNPNNGAEKFGHNLFIGKDITIKGEGEVNIYSLQENYPGHTESFIVVLISGSHSVVLDNLNIYPAYYYGTPPAESYTITNSEINKITNKNSLYVYQVQTIYTIRSLNRGLAESHEDIQNLTIRDCTIGEKTFPNNTSNSVIWLSSEINSAVGLTGGYLIENNTVYGGITICEDAGGQSTELGQSCIIRNNNLYDRIMLDGYRPTTQYNYQSLTVVPTITANTFYEVNWTQKTDQGNYDYCVYSRDKSGDKVLTETQLKEIIENNTFAGDLADKSIGIAIGLHKKDGNDEAHALIYAFSAQASITSNGLTTGYATLADAITAAQSGETITLHQDATISSATTVKNLTIAKGATLSFSDSGKLTVSGNLTVDGTVDLSGVSTDFTSGNSTEAANRTLTISTGATFDVSSTGTVMSKCASDDINQLGTMTLSAGAKYYIYKGVTGYETLYLGGEDDTAALGRIISGTIVSTPITAGTFAGGYTYTVTGEAVAGNALAAFPITGNDEFVVADGGKLTAANISTGNSAKNPLKSGDDEIYSCLQVKSGGTLAVGNTGNVTFATSVNYVKSGATVVLTDDINLTTYWDAIGMEVTWDLNGHNITTALDGASLIKAGGKLTVTGKGEIIKTGDKWSVFILRGNETDTPAKTSSLVIGKDVKVTGGNVPISIQRYSDTNCTTSYNVKVDIYGSLSGYQVIYANGNIKGTSGNVPEITLHSGAKIEGTSGLYLAGYTKTTIEDGVSINITGDAAENAIGIAAGELTINGGTFKSGNKLEFVEGEGGAIDSNTCCGLFVRQHSTNLPLKVTVNGGTFEAAIPFYQQTGMKGASAKPDDVTLSITDGTFTSTSSASEAAAVKSADKTGFITGGTFNTNPTAYVASGYAAVGNTDGTWTVKATSDNIKVTEADDKTTVTETATVGDTTTTTTTVTNKDGSTSTTVKTNEKTDSTGATTSTETTLEVKSEDNVKVETKTEAKTVKKDNVETTEATVTTTKGDNEPVVTTTKTVTDTDNKTTVNTTVSGTKATVEAKISENPVGTEKKAITVDATAAKASTNEVKTVAVTLPTATVKLLNTAATTGETDKQVETVELKTDVATLEIDNTALKTLTGAVGSNEELVLKVEKKDEAAQQPAVIDEATSTTTFELTAKVGDKDVFKSSEEGSSESNGEITVKVPYAAPKADEKVKVYYVDNQGNKEDMNATYADGYLTWNTNHFSLFMTATVKRAMTITGSDVETQNAKTVKVDLNVDSNSGIALLQLDLTYNKEVLTLTNVENGEVFEDFLDPTTTEAQELGASLDNLQFGDEEKEVNVEGKGKLATLTFKVADNAATGNYEIGITYEDENAIDVDNNKVKLTITNPTVKVVNVLYGDVDGDGQVLANDVMNLRRYIAKWKSYQNLANLKAGDVDGDGKYTLRDVAILGRHIAKWDGYTKLPYNA